jgi:hypothetical protein
VIIINLKTNENLSTLRLKMLKNGESRKKTNDFIRDLSFFINKVNSEGYLVELDPKFNEEKSCLKMFKPIEN